MSTSQGAEARLIHEWIRKLNHKIIGFASVVSSLPVVRFVERRNHQLMTTHAHTHRHTHLSNFLSTHTHTHTHSHTHTHTHTPCTHMYAKFQTFLHRASVAQARCVIARPVSHQQRRAWRLPASMRVGCVMDAARVRTRRSFHCADAAHDASGGTCDLNPTSGLVHFRCTTHPLDTRNTKDAVSKYNSLFILD